MARKKKGFLKSDDSMGFSPEPDRHVPIPEKKNNPTFVFCFENCMVIFQSSFMVAFSVVSRFFFDETGIFRGTGGKKVARVFTTTW